MAVLREHVPLFEEMLGVPGALADPALIFGYQEVRIPASQFRAWGELGWRERVGRAGDRLRTWSDRLFRGAPGPVDVPAIYECPSLGEVLQGKGLFEVVVLDLFDSRAELRFDMNEPVDPAQHGRYGTVIDIGCLEHLFDTRRCLENCFRMLRVGGHYMLHTPVNGYFAHGLHVFNPEALLLALELNGFELRYKRYSNHRGKVVRRPDVGGNVILWLVARKTRELAEFTVPQQGYWEAFFKIEDPRKRRELQERYWSSVG